MQAPADIDSEPPSAPKIATAPAPAEKAGGDNARQGLERRIMRMAFDMHDGPMQELIAVGYGLRALRETALSSVSETSAVRVGLDFDQLFAQLCEVERRLRSMMFALDESAAPDADLVTVVTDQANAFKRRSSAAIEVITEGDLELHTDSQRIAVERVLQESLSNIAKHADAANVTVQLLGTRKSVLLQVRDDGRGFRPEDAGRSGAGRIGLHSMKTRLHLIGSTLSVDSRPGGPTTITAVIEKWQPST
jgi:signal transduction histidine kinase